MTFPVDEPKLYPEINSRANLFYFLQNMSGLAAIKDHKPSGESPLPTEQIDTRQSQNGLAP